MTDTNRPLLFAGVAAGILFFVVTIVEIFARPGFDITRHAVSVLSLGERGWVMVATFIVSGLLTLLFAIGLRRALAGGRAGTWGPILMGIYGIGLVLAGLFPAPPGMGFPPGTPADMMPVMTPTAIVHSIAFMLAFSSLIAACFVFARRFSAIHAAAGVLIPVLIVLGMANVIAPGVAFYIAAMIAWLVVAAVALTLTAEQNVEVARAG